MSADDNCINKRNVLPARFSCLVCQRCDTFLCTSTDVLLDPVPGGVNPKQTFSYSLPFLMDLPEDREATCYVCSDDVTTRISIPSPSPISSSTHLSSVVCDPLRMDLVRVQSTVRLGLRQRLLPQRSAHRPNDDAEEVPLSNLVGEVYGVLQEGTAHIERLRWSDGGGSEEAAEGTSPVRQRRWFSEFRRTEMLSCPDCHTELGWSFEHLPIDTRSVPTAAEDAVPHSADESGPNASSNRKDDMVAQDSEALKEDIGFCGLILQRVKQRDDVVLQDVLTHFSRRMAFMQQEEEEEGEGNVAQNEERTPAADVGDTAVVGDGEGSSPPPAPTQRVPLIPSHRHQSTEELERMFSQRLQNELRVRLQALRMQTSLYSDLVTRHKEQSDVQKQLLDSQKERIATHEERLGTMASIIDAQKDQLKMQQKHIAYQEHLLNNQRAQISTQQQQIEVEQQLLTEQNKTIMTQLGQLRVLQGHVRCLAASSAPAAHSMTAIATTPDSEEVAPTSGDEPASDEIL